MPVGAMVDIRELFTSLRRCQQNAALRGHRLPGFSFRRDADKLQRRLRPIELKASDVNALVGEPVSAHDAIRAAHAGLHGSGNSLTGRWKKDKERSDPMDDACDAVALPWVLRRALAVLNYLEVEETELHFKTKIKAGGVLDVVETYPWTGEVRQHKRRDKRRGHHHGRVMRTDDGPCIRVEWENPYGGVCEDTFTLAEDGRELTQHTDMTIADAQRRCVYRTIYRRA